MSSQVGWRFPPTNGGRIDGYNDPGIAHFGGAPLSSLARETIQNSLDAQLASEEAVHVSFELAWLAPHDIGGNELKRAVAACKDETEEDKVVGPALAIAARLLGRSELTCLRVSDRNTIGLRGEHWRALVKMQGVSHKPDVVGAGGSYGIGKYAPFAVSALRTVFYWTSYRENGKLFEKCQGKSVLMSHQGTEGETQGTGFYGNKAGCSELTGDAHSRVLQDNDTNGGASARNQRGHCWIPSQLRLASAHCEQCSRQFLLCDRHGAVVSDG